MGAQWGETPDEDEQARHRVAREAVAETLAAMRSVRERERDDQDWPAAIPNPGLRKVLATVVLSGLVLVVLFLAYCWAVSR